MDRGIHTAAKGVQSTSLAGEALQRITGKVSAISEVNDQIAYCDRRTTHHFGVNPAIYN